ncbi:hypothetical protein MPSEU_001046200 [Mayamaea pseudoterrestris]|nr:hypothetical protein MPSEU_001046200 [Mayamaea pseudoterrestris]
MAADANPCLSALQSAMNMAIATITLTAVLDLLSIRTIRELFAKQANGRRVYLEGVAYNVINHILLGLPIYMITAVILCRKDGDDEQYTIHSPMRILIIIILHSIGYYQLHKAMHTRPGWYKFHAFHHRYKEFIPPSASNAVSPVDYVASYLLPFFPGTALTRPTTLELQTAINIVSVLSLLDHTPAMERLGDYLEPLCFVSARSHRVHHTAVTRNYAAPIWNLDWIDDRMKAWRDDWISYFTSCESA